MRTPPNITMSDSPAAKPFATERASAAPAGERGEAEEPELLRTSLAYVLKRTAARCDTILRQHLDGEISPARFSALRCVGANPGMGQTAPGSLPGIAGHSVVEVVDDLEKRGLLKRTPSPDRRVSALELADTGRTKLKRHGAAVGQCETKIAEALTEEERRGLIRLLNQVGVTDT